MTTDELQKLADLITANVGVFNKEVLNSQEAAQYMGISLSTLYKLTMAAKINHFKPGGKLIFFNRRDLEQWLQSNRVATGAEIAQKAQSFCQKGGGL